jgi:hypothetical protein
MRATESPMLTQELKTYQRLASDVQQAKASSDIHQCKKDWGNEYLDTGVLIHHPLSLLTDG